MLLLSLTDWFFNLTEVIWNGDLKDEGGFGGKQEVDEFWAGASTGKVTEEGGMLMLKEQQVVWLSWRIGVMGEGGGNDGTQVRRGPERDRCVCQAKW